MTSTESTQAVSSIGFDSTHFPVTFDNYQHDCSNVTTVSTILPMQKGLGPLYFDDSGVNCIDIYLDSNLQSPTRHQ